MRANQKNAAVVTSPLKLRVAAKCRERRSGFSGRGRGGIKERKKKISIVRRGEPDSRMIARMMAWFHHKGRNQHASVRGRFIWHDAPPSGEGHRTLFMSAIG